MSHLRIVPPGGEPPAAPRGRRRKADALRLTPEEERALRAAVRGLARTRYGTLRKLAVALGLDPDGLARLCRRRPSPALAVAVWRLTGIPLDTLLRPTLAPVPAPAPNPGGAA